MRHFVTTIFLIKIVLFYSLINFLAQMYFLMLIVGLFLLTFYFQPFFMIVQLCSFFLLYTYKTCLSFLVIKDSFTLEIPTLIFLSLQSICYHLLYDIRLYYPMLFPPTFGRRDYFPISPLTSYDKKCIKFLSAFNADRSLSMPPNV